MMYVAWAAGAVLLVYFAVELGWGGGKKEHGRRDGGAAGDGPSYW